MGRHLSHAHNARMAPRAAVSRLSRYPIIGMSAATLGRPGRGECQVLEYGQARNQNAEQGILTQTGKYAG